MVFPGYAKPDSLVVDAGVVYVGSNPLLKGTRGGLVFDPGKEMRHPEFDGKTTDIAGLHRNLRYNATIKGKCLMITPTTYEAGSSSDGSSGTNLTTMIDATEFLPSGAYLQNVRFIGRAIINGTAKTVEVVFAWALVETGPVTSRPDNEWEADVTIRAVLAPTETNLNLCPYVWKEVD